MPWTPSTCPCHLFIRKFDSSKRVSGASCEFLTDQTEHSSSWLHDKNLLLLQSSLRTTGYTNKKVGCTAAVFLPELPEARETSSVCQN